MSSYVESLELVFRNYSDSKKVKDKKEFIQSLIDITDNERARDEITGNTDLENVKEPNKITWHNIFVKCHQLIKEDTTSKTAKTVSQLRGACYTLVSNVVRYASTPAAVYLDCHTLVASLFEFLEDEAFKNIHDVYMKIFMDYVLSIRLYRVSMKLNHWKKLLKLCMTIYDYQYIDKSIVLRTMQKVVHHGYLQSQLLDNLKAILPFLLNVFEDTASNSLLSPKDVNSLLFTVCEQIGAECRKSLCEFSEAIMLRLIVTDDVTKFKLLLLFVELHHPNGANSTHPSAYAHNWTHWRRVIVTLYTTIIKDIKNAATIPDFAKLASEVFKVVMEDPNYLAYTNSGPNSDEHLSRAKRRRLAINISSPIDLLSTDFIDEDIDSQWAIIEILTAMIDKYPLMLNLHGTALLTDLLNKLFNDALQNEKVTDSLCKLCKVLVKTENTLCNDSTNTKASKKHWDKIWHILVKILGLGQSAQEGHELLQILIEHIGVLDVNAIIGLYTTNEIKWCNSSIHTLRIFCQSVAIPDNIRENTVKQEDSVQVRLLRWAFNISSFKAVPRDTMEALVEILIGLSLKTQWCKIKGGSHLNAPYDRDDDHKSWNNIIKYTLSLTYETDLFDESNLAAQTKRKRTLVKPSFADDTLNFVIQRLCQLTSCSKASVEDIHMLIFHIAVTAKFVSNLLEINVEPDDERIQTLLSAFKTAFTTASDLIVRHNLLRKKNVYTIQLLRAFVMLYENEYHSTITDVIVNFSMKEVLQSILTLMNVVNDSDPSEVCGLGIKYYEDIFELRDRCREQQIDVMSSEYLEVSDSSVITIGAHRVITLFCCFDAGTEMSALQAKALSQILQVEVYAPTVTGNLWQSLVFMKTVASCRKGFLSEEMMETITSFMEELFREWIRDANAIIGILDLLPRFVEHVVHHAQCNRQNILKILRRTHDLLADVPTDQYRFGPPVSVKFLQSFYEVIRIVPSIQFPVLNSTATQPITEILLCYLNNSSYVVRLEAVKIIHFIFLSNEFTNERKKKFFRDLRKIIFDSFTVERDMPDVLKKDEWMARVATALYVFGSIIHASGLFQSQALKSMLQLHGEKGIEIATIYKMLEAVVKKEADRAKLIDLNLHSLIMCWMNKEYDQHFPWMLTQATSEEEFYKKYMGVFILIRLENNNLAAIKTICDNLECSFEEVIEDNFASILTWVLVGQVSNEGGDTQQISADIFQQLMQNRKEFKTVKLFKVLLEQKLTDVMVNLLQKFYDPDHFVRMFAITQSLPRANLPIVDYDALQKCLHRLEECCSSSKEPLIEFLSRKSPHVIQKVLLLLSIKIYEFDMVEYKLKAFHQYACFCDVILQSISSPLLDGMAMFIIRDVSCTLLHVIKEEAEILADIAGKFLLRFLKEIISSRAIEVCEILNAVVTNLIVVIRSGKVKNIGLTILHFLIVESLDVLRRSIRKLDAFPTSLSFDEIRTVHDSLRLTTSQVTTLKEDIEHFLDSGHGKTITCSLEGLSHLKGELALKHEELKEMYQDLEQLRGFAEDCSSSILHRLMYKLVKLTENSDISISLEAAKCLGELGAADLTTMILHSEEGQKIEDGTPEEILTYQIIVELVEFLVENNIHLREASANALYEVCGSYWGQQVLSNGYLASRNEANNTKLVEYTQPFRKQSVMRQSMVELADKNYRACINSQNDLWSGNGRESYSNWITNLTCQVLDCFVNFYSASLGPVCKLSVEFCELILPKLIYLMISITSGLSERVCECLNEFFENYFKTSSTAEPLSLDSSKRTEVISLESVRCMLNIVNFIRIQSGDNFLLQLNYLHIAKAAQHCSAYFTSVLYAELACEVFQKKLTRASDNISIIDHICEKYPVEGKSLQHILREAFVQIGDPDSIHGCGLSHLKDPSSRIQHYIHLQQWDKVMISQDAELSSGYPFCNELANALRHSGLDYLLNRFTSSVKNLENMDEYQYETAWRLGDWNIGAHGPELTTNKEDLLQCISSKDYNFFHYQALKSLHANDNVALKDSIENARASIVKMVRNISLECSQIMYPKLVKLQMLRELEQLAMNNPEECLNLISHWNSENSLNLNDFSYVEPILSQRIAMCKIKYQLSGNPLVKNALIDTYLELAKIAESQGYPHIAARALALMVKHDDLSDEVKDKFQYHDALLAWARQDDDIARFLMRDIINKQNLNPSLKSCALRIYGNWMAETKSENPQSVIEKYYDKAISIGSPIARNSIEDVNSLNDTYAALAQFADAQYQQICSFMKTPQFENLQRSAKSGGRTAGMSTTSKDNEVKRALNTIKQQHHMDVTEYENIRSEQKMYLTLAVQYYLTTLKTGENHNFLVFRLVSLWLNNIDHKEVNKLFTEHLSKIPSFKFIPLVPQLAPHLTNLRSNSFQVQIYDLLKTCAKEHPHHTLPILLALMNTHKDNEYTKSASQKQQSEPNDRVLGATALIAELENVRNVSPIIKEMKRMASALIMLAYLPFESQKAVTSIHKSQEILKIRNYQYSIIPTITLDIRPRGDYDDIVSVFKYEERFEGVGGVNAPKKIVCVGTDGVRRKQLVKGKDDLRQDAVMQQVFTVMNLLLRTSKETKRRKLNIRTYKIVPLSQRSGVLEWCDNTLPILAVLQGPTGMHKKYHPQDWSLNTCRTNIQKAAARSAAVRTQVYKECCEHLQPAFQYFFMEKFPSPETWFERRLAYVRSVATTSMVGYILGLGDRHFSNILIDQTTAEVIHIDFGIAFEQGKVLPVPETIPFRLTRDMEAAMGVSGVEGVMRKCCEETMSVLRNRREIIITLLQVLLYDPLFSWTITPTQKAWQLQSDGLDRSVDENVKGDDKLNKIAERALLRIEQKLQGTEDGLATSIAGQVERLIQQARDPANLSRLFCGWQAYL